MSKLKIALVQVEITEADPPQNTENVLGFMDKAVGEGARLIVLPELWPIGFAPLELDTYAETFDGPSVSIMRDWAKEKGCYLLAGSIPEVSSHGILNKSYLFGPKGQVLGEYSKLHLFDLMGEKDTFIAGDKIMTADVEGFRVGVMICYDLRFPELAREYALNGVNLLLVPAMWPDVRIGHWDVLLRARAVENQIFVAGCNAVGNMTDLYFPGQSMIVNPFGNTLNEPNNRESLIIREINSKDIDTCREAVKYIDDRRDDIY
jgi:omega-amidase